MLFQDRVAIVTGASRGVGKEVCLALAREGCHIVAAAKTVEVDPRLPGTILDTAREVEALGRRALPVQVDVREDALVDQMVQRTMEEFGRIDFLVNNAGALFWRNMEETPMKRFDLVMGVNARGAFSCARAVLPHMLAQGYGHIVNMSPPIYPGAAGGKIAYMISKFGMTLIAHGLASEVGDRNVACNALWPATMIESYATINFGLGGAAMWRKADILADATVAIFKKEPRSFTGHALIDEDFLREEGVTDFTPYRCDPDSEPPRIPMDVWSAVVGKV